MLSAADSSSLSAPTSASWPTTSSSAWPRPALGIVPDLGGTKRLVDLVGVSRATEICLTARRHRSRRGAAPRTGLERRARRRPGRRPWPTPSPPCSRSIGTPRPRPRPCCVGARHGRTQERTAGGRAGGAVPPAAAVDRPRRRVLGRVTGPFAATYRRAAAGTASRRVGVGPVRASTGPAAEGESMSFDHMSAMRAMSSARKGSPERSIPKGTWRRVFRFATPYRRLAGAVPDNHHRRGADRCDHPGPGRARRQRDRRRRQGRCRRHDRGGHRRTGRAERVSLLHPAVVLGPHRRGPDLRHAHRGVRPRGNACLWRSSPAPRPAPWSAA